ncbi:hypothetical protein E2542_SST22497 [Spatholobus suberectus]|nr:hypothetical protein E2542_SST22497 [Spatholobus suberectus]
MAVCGGSRRNGVAATDTSAEVRTAVTLRVVVPEMRLDRDRAGAGVARRSGLVSRKRRMSVENFQVNVRMCRENKKKK